MNSPRYFITHAMIHIGQLIEKELRRQERSVSWFARKLYCDRSNVYDIFRRENIDADLLLRISIVLNHNFFQYYMEQLGGEREK